MLGGIQFDHPAGPVGHSDGDAVLHAVTDALLGAIGEPDIGQLFPDTDPQHEGQNSVIFLHEAVRRITTRGFRLGNLDITVICERPKIGPRRDEMCTHLASLLGCDRADVNIKGKTHEGVDAVGEGRAIEVHVVVMLVSADADAKDGS